MESPTAIIFIVDGIVKSGAFAAGDRPADPDWGEPPPWHLKPEIEFRIVPPVPIAGGEHVCLYPEEKVLALCTICYSTHMVPLRISFRAGVSLFEQVVYASKKAIVSGQLRPGDPFPSVRALSKELKINPNPAHKIVAYLVNDGLLETRPGIGTVVAVLPESSRKERTQLLGHEIEELVVEGKRLGIELGDMLSSIAAHWERLSVEGPPIAARPGEPEDTHAAEPRDGGSKEL